MPVPTDITTLDTTAANNSPPGTESAKGSIDNYIRQIFAFIKTLYNSVELKLNIASYASQAQMEAAAVDTVFVTPAKFKYSPLAVKAMGVVNGTTAAVTGGSGFTAVRDSAGVYTITLTTAMSSANYVVICTSTDADRLATWNTLATGSFKVNIRIPSGSNSDATFSVIVLGDHA